MRHNFLYSLVLLFLCYATLTVNAQTEDKLVYLEDDYRFLPEKLVDFEHLTVKLRIDPLEKKVLASARFLFRQIRSDVDSVVLLAKDFSIQQVTIDRIPVRYSLIDKDLIVNLPVNTKKGASHALRIDYEVFPDSELYFIGWDDTTNRKRKQIWAHRPYYWLPYADDRLTTDFHITFDAHYKVFSNGVRESVQFNNDGTATWHYKMYRNHPFFSTALIIGDYDWESTSTAKGLPVELWYYPDRKTSVEPTYRYMHDMIAFCENEFDFPYPYEIYRQAPVTDYLFGGMETTTSTIFGDFMHIDKRAFWERNYINVNIHELVHQWFGNYISHLRHKDVWLTESFATYYAKLFEKQVFGNEYYEWERLKEHKRVIEASSKDNYPLAHSRGGVDRWYPKGSLVLDMLRDELGEHDFRKAINFYLKSHPYQEVWTPELIRDIHESTGRSMDWFFDQWVERGGEPHFGLSYTKEPFGIAINAQQLQDINNLRPVFKVPVQIEVWFADGSMISKKFLIDSANMTLPIQWEDQKSIDFVLFDPGARILKTVDFPRTIQELSAQLSKAKHLIDRYDALVAMQPFPIVQKREVLISCFAKESFHLTKAEIVRQLSADNFPSSNQLIIGALADKDPLVRREAISGLQLWHQIPEELISLLLRDESYSNIRIALEKLSSLYPERTDEWLETTRNETGFPGMNIRISWLRMAIAVGHKEFLTELTDYAGLSFDFTTRINAIQALLSLNQFDEAICDNLIEASLHWNFKLNSVAIDALRKYYAAEFNKTIIDNRIGRLEGDNDELIRSIRKK